MADVRVYTVDEPYFKIDCVLGESPFWEQTSNTLRFLDIVKQKVHTIGLDEGPVSHKVLADLDISVGVTCDIEGDDEHFFFGGKHGYGIINRTTGRYQYVKKYWSEREMADGKGQLFRANDGAVDARGRFFVGTMHDPLVKSPEPEGTLFRQDPDLSLHRVLERVQIPNGISWTDDNLPMYFTDWPSRNILTFDYDENTGSLSNQRIFFHVDEGKHGVPDGHALDAQGYMWIAIYGAAKVLRVSPAGEKVAEIRLPTRCPTCPAFAGEDLYITSAEEQMPHQFPESARFHGSLFRVHVGVRGAPLHRLKFAGEKP